MYVRIMWFMNKQLDELKVNSGMNNFIESVCYCLCVLYSSILNITQLIYIIICISLSVKIQRNTTYVDIVKYGNERYNMYIYVLIRTIMYVRRLAAQKYIASCVCLMRDCLLTVQFVVCTVSILRMSIGMQCTYKYTLF